MEQEMMRFLLPALLAALAISSTAHAADAAKRSCFRNADVDGFQAIDSDTVNVTVGVHDVYQLKLFSPSPDIDWTQRIGLESRGGSWICSGLDAVVIVPGPMGVQRYQVSDIRKLSPEEAKASSKKPR